MAGETRPFVVMAKPAGSRCNMRCAYCYYLKKARFSTHRKQTRMSTDLLEKLIRQTIECCPGDVVSFVWHGGEPTLAGLAFYKKAVELEKKYLPRGKQCWNNLQTNGLLLDDEWCDFLKKERFDVGLSIDGAKMYHDLIRRDEAGEGTYESVRAACECLKRHGILPDLLCTVNSKNAGEPLETYRALRALDTGWIQFIPIVIPLEDGSVSPLSVTPEGYGEFLCRVFDEWLLNDLGKCDVQLFAETSRVLAGGEAGLCWMQPVCGSALVAEEDGGIYSCDHFVDNEHRLGTLGKVPLRDMALGERQQSFGSMKKDGLPEACLTCSELFLCNGGCPKDRLASGNYLCPGLKMFFAHARGPLTRAIGLSREGLDAAGIQETLRREYS